jgi:putative ABC transport system permease protein
MSRGILGEVSVVARGVLRRPAFGATVVLVMALGIGAVTTMFSTMDSVILRPLPFDEPGDLVWLYSSSAESPRNSSSAVDYLDYRRDFKSFESVAALGVLSPAADLPAKEGTEPYRLTLVSHNFFSTLRVRQALGRTFVPADELAGGAHVVVVSHRFWRDHMGGRADILQQSLDLDGTVPSVVGVMPADFAFPEGVDLWLPLRHDHPAAEGRGNNNFSMFGRLKPGVGLEGARAEATVLARRIAQAHPDSKAGWGLLLTPMHEVFFGDYRQAMTLLMAAVVLLLLVACANVSSLFLARGVSRRGEFAMRAALGASRARLAWRVLLESGLLAASGGAAGLALAWAGIRGVRALAPAAIPRVDPIAIDARAAAVTAGVCVAAGLLAGLAPALRGARVQPVDAIRREGRVVGTRPATALRSGLIVAQLALSLVLLLGSGLLVRSFLAMQRADIGFARPASLVWLVVRRGAWLAGLGFALGLCGGRALSGLMPSLLYQIKADDLPTIAVVSGVLGLVTVAACAIPASRAASVDPVSSLRSE